MLLLLQSHSDDYCKQIIQTLSQKASARFPVPACRFSLKNLSSDPNNHPYNSSQHAQPHKTLLRHPKRSLATHGAVECVWDGLEAEPQNEKHKHDAQFLYSELLAYVYIET